MDECDLPTDGNNNKNSLEKIKIKQPLSGFLGSESIRFQSIYLSTVTYCKKIKTLSGFPSFSTD